MSRSGIVARGFITEIKWVVHVRRQGISVVAEVISGDGPSHRWPIVWALNPSGLVEINILGVYRQMAMCMDGR